MDQLLKAILARLGVQDYGQEKFDREEHKATVNRFADGNFFPTRGEPQDVETALMARYNAGYPAAGGGNVPAGEPGYLEALGELSRRRLQAAQEKRRRVPRYDEEDYDD